MITMTSCDSASTKPGQMSMLERRWRREGIAMADPQEPVWKMGRGCDIDISRRARSEERGDACASRATSDDEPAGNIDVPPGCTRTGRRRGAAPLRCAPQRP